MKSFIFVVLLISIFISGCFGDYDYPDIDTPADIIGGVDAKVKVVEFSDLQCPACKAAQPIIKLVIEEFDDVSLEFKHYPLDYHHFAFDAAQAAECANDQGKFWEYIDTAYESESLNNNNLERIAEEIGLDMKDFKNCLYSGAKGKYVTEDMSDGDALVLPGTPSVFVNGEMIENWDYDKLKSEIESALS